MVNQSLLELLLGRKLDKWEKPGLLNCPHQCIDTPKSQYCIHTSVSIHPKANIVSTPVYRYTQKPILYHDIE